MDENLWIGGCMWYTHGHFARSMFNSFWGHALEGNRRKSQLCECVCGIHKGNFDLEYVRVFGGSFGTLFSRLAHYSKTAHRREIQTKISALWVYAKWTWVLLTSNSGDCIWGTMASNLSGSSGVLIYQNISKMTDHIVDTVKNRASRGVEDV